MSTILFSHGFGVKADARGMFTEIANTFPQHTFIFLDYNKTLENGDIEVSSLDAQAKILQDKLTTLTEPATLIAHSQGSVVASMTDLHSVEKVILLAPPVEMSVQRMTDKLLNKPGAEVDLDGVSKLPRSDGTTTHIPKSYIESLRAIEPLELYDKAARTISTTIVRCTQDEILGLTDVNKIRGAKHVDMMSDHNFNGDTRRQLLDFLKRELG